MEKKIFKLPVEWAVYSTVEVEAETMEEAIKVFHETEEEISLPTDPDYIDGSFKLSYDDDEIEQFKLFNPEV